MRASGPHPHCGSEDQELTSYERTSAIVVMDAMVGVVVATWECTYIDVSHVTNYMM